MSVEEIKALMRRFVEEWNKGKAASSWKNGKGMILWA